MTVECLNLECNITRLLWSASTSWNYYKIVFFFTSFFDKWINSLFVMVVSIWCSRLVYSLCAQKIQIASEAVETFNLAHFTLTCFRHSAHSETLFYQRSHLKKTKHVLMWTPISESLKLKTKFDMPESTNLTYSDMIEHRGTARCFEMN